MTSILQHWDALCDQLDEAIAHWQRLYRDDASATEAAYRRVIDVGDDMTRFMTERLPDSGAPT